MIDFLAKTRKTAYIGIVGGSDLNKQKEQLGESLLDDFDYVFSENGLVAFKDGKSLASKSLSERWENLL